MSDPDVIKSSFQKWKIWAAIFLGISVAGFMLYRSLNETRFVKVGAGKGTHRWVDGNHNKVVDLTQSIDFKLDNVGDYKIESLSDVLLSIHWTEKTLLWIFIALLCMVGRDFFYMRRIR